jgi:ligand-binding sensor domain-containing protein
VWFSTGDYGFHRANGGLYRFAGGQTQHILKLPSIGADSGQEDNIQALGAAPDGSLWAANGGRIARYSHGSWHAASYDPNQLLGDATDFAFTPDGATWVAFVFKLVRISGDEVVVYDKMIHSVAVMPDGTLWGAGWEGRQDSHFVARFDGRDWLTYPVVPLFGGGLGMLTAGRDGWLWGTSASGLLRLRPNGSERLQWDRYEFLDGLPAAASSRAAIGRDGTVWVAAGSALAYFDGEAWHAAGRLGEGTPSALAAGPDGSLWVGTLEGRVWRLDVP